jgi:hypothetical protein
LRHLGLHNNALGDYGASLLASALRSNTSLTSLDLRLNGIRDMGGFAIHAALQANMHSELTSLRLGGNVVRPEILEMIELELEQNRKRIRVRVQGNQNDNQRRGGVDFRLRPSSLAAHVM